MYEFTYFALKMNQLYTKFLSYEGSIPTCSLNGKDQICQTFKLSGFHQILKQKKFSHDRGKCSKVAIL